MGWTVHDVKRASVWEFWTAFQGYVDANTPKEGAKLTPEQADDLFDWIDRAPTAATLSTETYKLDGLHLVPAGIVTFAAQ